MNTQSGNLIPAAGLAVLLALGGSAPSRGTEIPSIRLEVRTNDIVAEGPPGPMIPVGSPVTWTYVLTNTGNVTLSDITVTDSVGGIITATQNTLEPGQEMVCMAGGVAVTGQYTNTGTVAGTSPDGTVVTSSDTSYYFGMAPAIVLETTTNGQSADSPPGPALAAGSMVTWTYIVTNVGNVRLTNVAVTDDMGVTVAAPKSTLEPGESMMCTASGVVVPGQYSNIGTATASSPLGTTVTDSDPSHYFGLAPAIAIETLTNGEDADVPPGPKLAVGSTVLWTYVVTNTGNVRLTDVAVTDSNGIAVTAPKTTLEPGESMTATGAGIAEPGQYSNIGTATGTAMGMTVTDSDPCHYTGMSAAVSIEVRTNGEEADEEPGPTVTVGDPVVWTYEITNTGGYPLTEIAVVDDRGVAVALPKTALEPGESMTGTASGNAKAGQYGNTGTVSAAAPDGSTVTASDASHYYGQIPWLNAGYWKNHTRDWPPTGYSPAQTVGSVFAEANRYPKLAGSTLVKALALQGGPADEGAAQILVRQAIAALLNASHPNIAFPLTPADVIARTNAALAGDRAGMLECAAYLTTGGWGYAP